LCKTLLFLEVPISGLIGRCPEGHEENSIVEGAHVLYLEIREPRKEVITP
jgi:hypothetical protein